MNKKQRAIHLAKISSITEDVLDKSAEEGQATKEKQRASFIADAIAKNIFKTGKHIHAINNIIYNETNGSILLILYPVANDNVGDIIELVKQVRGVKSVSDNPINDEETLTDYHVLKVTIAEEGMEDDDSEDEYLDLDDQPSSIREPSVGRPEGSSPVFGPGIK